MGCHLSTPKVSAGEGGTRPAAVGANVSSAFASYDSLLDSIPHAVVLAHTDGTIVRASRHLRSLLGYSGEEVTGKNIDMFMAPEIARAHPSYVDRYLRTGIGRIIGTQGRRVPAIHKDGHTVHVLLTVEPVQDKNGVPHFLGTLTDLGRHDREEALVRQLDNMQLQVDARQQVLRFVTHEVRNALAPVSVGCDHMLQIGADDATLLAVSRASEAALEILNGILDIERLKAGHNINKEWFSAAEWLNNLSTTAELHAKDRNVAVRVEYSDALSCIDVLGSEAKLTQCLVNYFTNALKFSEGGTVTLYAYLEVVPDKRERRRRTGALGNCLERFPPAPAKEAATQRPGCTAGIGLTPSTGCGYEVKTSEKTSTGYPSTESMEGPPSRVDVSQQARTRGRVSHTHLDTTLCVADTGAGTPHWSKLSSGRLDIGTTRPGNVRTVVPSTIAPSTVSDETPVGSGGNGRGSADMRVGDRFSTPGAGAGSGASGADEGVGFTPSPHISLTAKRLSDAHAQREHGSRGVARPTRPSRGSTSGAAPKPRSSGKCPYAGGSGGDAILSGDHLSLERTSVFTGGARAGDAPVSASAGAGRSMETLAEHGTEGLSIMNSASDMQDPDPPHAVAKDGRVVAVRDRTQHPPRSREHSVSVQGSAHGSDASGVRLTPSTVVGSTPGTRVTPVQGRSGAGSGTHADDRCEVLASELGSGAQSHTSTAPVPVPGQPTETMTVDFAPHADTTPVGQSTSGRTSGRTTTGSGNLTRLSLRQLDDAAAMDAERRRAREAEAGQRAGGSGEDSRAASAYSVGRPRREVDSELDSGEGRSGLRLRVGVRDTGFGISQEHLARLFTTFEQLPNHLTRKGVGTGIGLAFVHDMIIKGHGGTVGAQSDGNGRGADFFITLPSRSLRRTSGDAVPLAVADGLVFVGRPPSGAITLSGVTASASASAPSTASYPGMAATATRQSSSGASASISASAPAPAPPTRSRSMLERMPPPAAAATRGLVLHPPVPTRLPGIPHETTHANSSAGGGGGGMRHYPSRSTLTATSGTSFPIGMASAHGGAPGPGALNVVIVDDQEMLRALLARVLSRRGFYVRAAASGEDALDLLRTPPPGALPPGGASAAVSVVDRKEARGPAPAPGPVPARGHRSAIHQFAPAPMVSAAIVEPHVLVAQSEVVGQRDTPARSDVDSLANTPTPAAAASELGSERASSDVDVPSARAVDTSRRLQLRAASTGASVPRSQAPPRLTVHAPDSFAAGSEVGTPMPAHEPAHGVQGSVSFGVGTPQRARGASSTQRSLVDTPSAGSEDGQSMAEQWVPECGWHAVVTDVNMPGARVEGEELARIVKATFPNVVVIAVTGDDAGRVRHTDLTLTKPVNATLLSRRLHQLVNRQRRKARRQASGGSQVSSVRSHALSRAGSNMRGASRSGVR